MNLRSVLFCAGVLAAGPVACASQKIEPQVASSASQANYAMDYPGTLQSVSNDFVNSESEVRRLTTEFAKYPDQLKDPPWPVVASVVSHADEAGRSSSYVDARRELEATQTFFTQEREEITRRVAGSAQYVVKKKECDVDTTGAVSSSLKEAVDKEIEKRLRGHNDAYVILERYREALGKGNAAALEKQIDDISAASYVAYIRSIERKAAAVRLLDEANEVKGALDRTIADEHAFQAETGRTAADKKASNDRIAKMEDGKVRIDAGVPQLQALAKDIDQRTDAMRKEYQTALDNLKKAIAAKSSAK